MTLTIQQILDLIEQRLDSQLTAAELAEKSGYSTFYFYRLFQQEVGMPIMQYITRRKLLAAIIEISKGAGITETGLKFGFATHSGFFRAFVKEYGFSPSDYLINCPLPLQYCVQLEKEQYKFMHINQIKKLLPNWNMTVTKVAPVYQPNGKHLSEHVWQIGTEYYLKLFDTCDSLQRELAVMDQIKNKQKILPSVTGKDYIKVQENYFVLFHKAIGEPILSADILKHPEEGRFIGENIGQLTQQLAMVTGDFPENELLKNITEWALPKAGQTLKLASKWTKDFQAQITKLFPELPRQVIHRDLNGGNLLVAKNSFTPIDFDLVEINFRVYDPCYFLTSVLSEQFGKDTFTADRWWELVREIFIGYNKVVKLTNQEKKAIPYIMLSNQLVCLAYFSEYEKHNRFLLINKKLTQFLITEFDKLLRISCTL